VHHTGLWIPLTTDNKRALTLAATNLTSYSTGSMCVIEYL
jgi:hypothetical protein